MVIRLTSSGVSGAIVLDVDVVVEDVVEFWLLLDVRNFCSSVEVVE